MVLQHDGKHTRQVVGFHLEGLTLFLEFGVGVAVLKAHTCHNAERCLAQHVLTVVFKTVGNGHRALFPCEIRHADAITLHCLAHHGNAKRVVYPAGDGFFLGFLLGECRRAQQQCD